MEYITKSEKAALYFQIIEGCNDWQLIFSIAIGSDRFNALSDKAKQTSSSRWKTSHKIQKAKEELTAILQTKKDTIVKNAVEEIQRGETETTATNEKKKKSNDTDFLNRDEFLRFLNDRANEVQDDKLRNDILKMLSDNMRYKESENEGTAEIQRFYTPQTCESCEIYNKCKGCKVAECYNI